MEWSWQRIPSEYLVTNVRLCREGKLGKRKGFIHVKKGRIEAVAAYHDACHLAHAQGIVDPPRRLLAQIPGLELRELPESEICCGSAGTYSLLQPKLSERLRENKRRALTSGRPQAIATANIGCLSHLRDDQGPPVMHWIELLAERVP